MIKGMLLQQELVEALSWPFWGNRTSLSLGASDELALTLRVVGPYLGWTKVDR